MSIFRVDVEVAPLKEPGVFRSAGKLLVDTGSEVSWISAGFLREMGVEVAKPGQGFQMANGQAIERDVGYAVLRAEGFETVDEVVFAHEGDLQLLGVRTLEGFNAKVDPVSHQLVAAGPIIAAQNRR
jgi:predicted aspartyl protease